MARRKLDNVFAKVETAKEEEVVSTSSEVKMDHANESKKLNKKENQKSKTEKRHARVGVYLPSQEVARAMKRLATEEDKRPNTLYLEALVLLFKNRGLPVPKELSDIVS